MQTSSSRASGSVTNDNMKNYFGTIVISSFKQKNRDLDDVADPSPAVQKSKFKSAAIQTQYRLQESRGVGNFDTQKSKLSEPSVYLNLLNNSALQLKERTKLKTAASGRKLRSQLQCRRGVSSNSNSKTPVFWKSSAKFNNTSTAGFVTCFASTTNQLDSLENSNPFLIQEQLSSGASSMSQLGKKNQGGGGAFKNKRQTGIQIPNLRAELAFSELSFQSTQADRNITAVGGRATTAHSGGNNFVSTMFTEPEDQASNLELAPSCKYDPALWRRQLRSRERIGGVFSKQRFSSSEKSQIKNSLISQSRYNSVMTQESPCASAQQSRAYLTSKKRPFTVDSQQQLGTNQQSQALVSSAALQQHLLTQQQTPQASHQRLKSAIQATRAAQKCTVIPSGSSRPQTVTDFQNVFYQLQDADDYRKEPLHMFRKIPVHQREQNAATSPQACQKIKAVKIGTPVRQLRQKRESLFLNRQEQALIKSKEAGKEAAWQTHQRKDKEKKPEVLENIEEPEQDDFDVDKFVKGAQRELKDKLRADQRRRTHERVDGSMKKLRQNTTELCEELVLKDFYLDLSDTSSNHRASQEYEVMVDNTIHNRIFKLDDKNYDEKGQPKQAHFTKRDFGDKDGRRDKLAESVIRAGECEVNYEFLIHQQKMSRVARLSKFTIFNDVENYLNNTDMQRECESSSPESSSYEQTIFDTDQAQNLKKKQSKLSVAIKKALVKNVFDNLSQSLIKKESGNQLRTVFNILQAERDPYIEILDSEFKKKQQIKERVAMVVKLLQFTEIGRFMGNEAIREAFSMEPLMIYHEQMRKTDEVALPLLNKIIQNKLILIDYTLDKGHCEALALSIKKTKLPQICAVLLDNCGIDDDEIYKLLDGLQVMDGFERFVYKNNVFFQQGLAALKPILTRPAPYNLQELRLVNLQTDPDIIHQLLDFMIEFKVQIRSLSLVQLRLRKTALLKVAVLLDDSDYLEQLDLSWNNVLPMNMIPFLEVLSRQKNIKSLNLSWNNLIEIGDMNNEFDVTKMSLLDDYVQARIQAIREGRGSIEDSMPRKSDHPNYVMYCLSMFVRHSKCLQTLILDNCGLNSQVLCGLVRSIRHAKSLVCIHLDFNPGINDQVMQYYLERMRCKEEERPIHIEVLSKNTRKSYLEDQKKKISQMSVWSKMHLEDQFRVEEVCQYISNQRLKPLVRKGDIYVTGKGDCMSFSRILNFKIMMPGEAQWRIHTTNEPDQCWACDNWIFTIIYWNKHIGKVNSVHSIEMAADNKKHVIEKIKRNNEGNFRQNSDRPILFSNSTNWKPRPFFDMFELLDKIEPVEMPNIDDKLFAEAQETYNFQDLDELSDVQVYAVKRFLIEGKRNHQRQWRRKRILDGLQILKDNIGGYRRPLIVNEHLVRVGNYEDMWVLPIFLKPGKSDNLIRAPEDQRVLKKIEKVGRNNVQLLSYQEPDDAEFFFFYQRLCIDIREEPIPAFAKKLRINSAQFRFQKDQSVFCDWREDNYQILVRCMHDDFKNWKMEKIVKEMSEKKNVIELYKKHYQRLKDIFISTFCTFTPPNISYKDFIAFCQMSNILDRRITSGVLAVYFNATNFEEVDQEQNDDKELCRFEFMEIIIRIAKGKFMDFGNMKSISEATERLITDHILPMQKELTPWHEFRVEQIWCIEVNDLLLCNTAKLQKLYKTIAELRKYKQRYNLLPERFSEVSIDQLTSFLYRTIPGISEKQIIRAFQLSKMTCIEPLVDGNVHNTFIKWVEFLEFLCRLAYFKFEKSNYHTEWPLVKKLKTILDHVLSLVDEKRTDPPELTQVISESDDDY